MRIKALKRIYNVITTVTTVLVILLAVLLVGVRLFGIKPYTVLSGSMEPTYHVGSLVYVKDVDPYSMKLRDPVTYSISGTVVTHRIVEVLDEGTPNVRYRTQGDANETPDGEPLRPENIIGKPIFSIPLLGYLANLIQNPPGTYYAIIICAALLVLAFIPDSIFKNDKDDAPLAESATPSPDEVSDENTKAKN